MINRQNYLWVRAFLEHLGAVMQVSPRSTSRYWFYLRHVLRWADATSLDEAPRLRPTFPTYLTTAGLAPATVKKILQLTQRFFRWARLTFPQDFRAVPAGWVESLRPPRQAAVIKEHAFVTAEDVEALARLSIPEADLALRRDQACAVLLFLSGMRIGALATLPLEAVNLAERSIRQWPALGVHTKNGKAATTFLLPIPALLEIAQRWDVCVRQHLPPAALWCPPIGHTWGEQALTVQTPGANRHIALNKRLRRLFQLAGLPPQSAHKFRHGHAVWALQHARTMADYKAISQNLMHGDIRVTDGIYAPLLGSEVAQRVARLAEAERPAAPLAGDLTGYLSGLSHQEVPAALRLLADRLAKA